jgi:UDP-N-acetylmuramate dehydrogenase
VIMGTTVSRSTLPTGKKEVYKELFQTLSHRLKRNVPLAPYTTFGIGGKADLFYQATKPGDLVFIIRTARKLGIRFFLLGGGSNVLISDSGFRGLVIRNQCGVIRVNKESITCQSGGILNDVVNLTCKNGLSGMEFAAGIPGTIGGAIRGNAGAFGKSVGEVLTQAVILTTGGDIKEVAQDYFRFAYRESRLKHSGEVLLSATFKLKELHREKIQKKITENLKKRKENLPWQNKSAGCFFKNVVSKTNKIAAGFLLDEVGAKEMYQGEAKVSEKHANILINGGSATARDVRRLAQRLKSKVKEKFDIKLEEEVVYIN